MSRLLRVTGWIILLLVVLVVALLAVVRFRPDAAVWAANSLLDDTHITTQDLKLRYFPPSLELASATVDLPDQTIATTEVAAQFDASAWRSNAPFWAVTAENVTIDAKATQTAPVEDAGPANVALPNLRPFLSFTRLGVKRLEMTGDSPLSASLSADRQNAETVVDVSVDQGGSHYTLKGTVGSPDTGPMAFDFTINGVPDAGGAELDAKIAGTLKHSGGTTLQIASGAATLTQGESVQQLDQLQGTVRIPSSGDTIQVEALTAQVTSPDSGIEKLPVAMNATTTFGSAAIAIDTDGSLSETKFDAQLEIANATGVPSGKISLTSESLPAGIEHAPYSKEQLFPLGFSTEFRWQDNTLSLQDMKLDSPSNALGGSVTVATVAPWKLIADIKASKLFYPLVSDSPEAAPETDAAGEAEEVGEKAGEKVAEAESSRLFSEDALDWSWIQTAEIDAKLEAAELALQDASFTDLKVALKNADGKLSLEPLSASLGDGGFSGSAELSLAPTEGADTSTPVALTALFKMAGVSLESFGLVPTEELSGGKVEADINLSSKGNSQAELASGLNGEILMMIEEATLMNDFVELAGSDLVMETLNKLNPFAKKDPTTELSCALVRFTAEDGNLTTKNQLVMETSKMEIIGTGNINLNDEKISLGITPNAKSGVGVNIGSAVKFMKLGGTLSAPRPAVSAGGLLKSGLAIGAAISTGGASVVAEGLAKRALNAGSACEAVRKEATQEQ